MKDIADPRFSNASAPAHVSRALLRVVAERQGNAERVCLGLGFTPTDLARPGFRLSHRQSYLLVRRVIEQVGDKGLGLLVGGRQSAVSLGLVGLGMQACATLGEALELGLQFQRHAGAMLGHDLEIQGDSARLLLTPLFYEPDVQAFYMEEAFSSSLSIVRHLSVARLRPRLLCLDYPRPAHADLYEALFECPVRFGEQINAIEFDSAWLDMPLATRDDAVAAEVVELLKQARWLDQERSELIEGLQREVRKQLDAPPSLAQLARQLNISERTLRRRIESAGLSYQGIIDESRRARALVLLGRDDLSLAEVAVQTGFSDVRNFRRAFKRWTGLAPREARKGLLQQLGEMG
ncbi:AraC family transcriptional regulator [Pseudomonas sp. AA-38]|uniref:AraC family transcriptional regulator n=1 Tax=Pseudomonas sp. AA-38 TaxID=3028807 RepID=UPI0023F648FE|nr:AraC family transcriptional regulator [Pseudomonas sp. AA-38]